MTDPLVDLATDFQRHGRPAFEWVVAHGTDLQALWNASDQPHALLILCGYADHRRTMRAVVAVGRHATARNVTADAMLDAVARWCDDPSTHPGWQAFDEITSTEEYISMLASWMAEDTSLFDDYLRGFVKDVLDVVGDAQAPQLAASIRTVWPVAPTLAELMVSW